MNWESFRNQLRRSILDDIEPLPEEESIAKWSDVQLLDAFGWALDVFAAHTAYAKLSRYNNQTDKIPGLKYDFSKDREIILPDDAYEPIDVSGVVYVENKAGEITYLDPLEYTPGKHPYRATQAGFYLWPDNQLNIVGDFKTTDTIYIRYFAYYPRPVLDADIIPIPRWAELPLAYLTGALALNRVAVQSAGIDRWKDRSDSGNPEQNALRKQQEWLMQLYEQAIFRYPRQDRLSGFRNE